MLLASALTCLVLALTVGRQLGVFSGRLEHVYQFAALLDKIEGHFIGEYDESDISVAAMRAAVDALDDDWSYYLTPEERTRQTQRTSNRYSGIGVGVVPDEDTGGMRVQYVYAGSSAEKAGILPGDIIIGVDGTDVTGYDMDMLRDTLARPIGSAAEIEILRDSGVTQTLSVMYELVFDDPVSYEMLDGDIGYISLSNFNSGSADSFISAAGNLIESGARSFVFDVRNNYGGLLSEMLEMLNYLLPEGGELFVAVGKSGEEQIFYNTGPNSIDLPAVVLADRYSYSAAEYFAAILREYDYAEIVGEQTTGKGRSQQVIELPGGGAINISTAQYLTKNRVSLHDAGGIIPDHQIILTDDEHSMFLSGRLANEDDPQLRQAIELLMSP